MVWKHILRPGLVWGVCLGCGAFCTPQKTQGATVLYTWSGAISGVTGTESGSALFSTAVNPLGGYTLTIVLSNTALMAPSSTSALLSGLYFDITSSVPQAAIGMMSAVATGGRIDATHLIAPAPGTTDFNICAPGVGRNALDPSSSGGCPVRVGGGWEAAYRSTGLGGSANATQHYGIGTTAQGGVFRSSGRTGVGSSNYGIAPGNGVGLVNPDSGLRSAYPYINGLATFQLRGLTTDQVTITHVAAVYGTGSTSLLNAAMYEPAAPGPVPEPGTWILAGGALLWLVARSKRSPRSN